MEIPTRESLDKKLGSRRLTLNRDDALLTNLSLSQQQIARQMFKELEVLVLDDGITKRRLCEVINRFVNELAPPAPCTHAAGTAKEILGF